MKHLPNLIGALLGLAFVAFGAMFLLNMVPKQPDPPEGSAIAHFMTAFGPTGYMKFVKVIEVIGGILVAIPRTRNLGLLALGPVLVNIIAFNTFITGGVGLFSPLLIILCLMAAYLLWAGRKSFASLLN